VRCPLSFTLPRPTGSTLLVRLRLTSRRSVFRPSLKVRWLRLILFRSRVLLAVVAPCLHSKSLDLLSRDLMFVFVYAQEGFLLWIPLHPSDFITVTSSLRFDMTSFLPLRLYIDRGLVRHRYPWVPTDQGPRDPCQVDPTCQKPSRPASGPGDLIHSPDDLGRPRTTSSKSRATC
jgi:hypothetical protein